MMADDQDPMGVLSGRFVPGALRVDASEYAKVHGLPGGTGSLRLSDVDETEATLAWDAAAAVLRDEQIVAEGLGGLVVVSSDAEDTAGFVSKVLAREDLEVRTFAGSRESAVDAFVTACALAQGAGGPVLYVAAQDTTWSVRKKGESGMEAAGAVALLVGKEAPVVWQGGRTFQHLRGSTPVKDIVRSLQDDQDAVVSVTVSSLSGLKPWQKAARDRRMASSLLEQVGDLGPVAPGAALLAALDESEVGKGVAVVVPGEHRSRTLSFTVGETPRVLPVKQSLEHAVDMDPVEAGRVRSAWVEAQAAEPRGAYVPLAVFHAQDPARLRLVGGKCRDCDRVLFPPRERCPHCGEAKFADHAFSGKGTVHSWTMIRKGGAPSEFAPLQSARGAYAVAVVELKEGPRVAAMLTGAALDGTGMEIGAPVRLVPRLVYVQERAPRYSFKALPAPEDEEPEGEGQAL